MEGYVKMVFACDTRIGICGRVCLQVHKMSYVEADVSYSM